MIGFVLDGICLTKATPSVCVLCWYLASYGLNEAISRYILHRFPCLPSPAKVGPWPGPFSAVSFTVTLPQLLEITIRVSPVLYADDTYKRRLSSQRSPATARYACVHEITASICLQANLQEWFVKFLHIIRWSVWRHIVYRTMDCYWWCWSVPIAYSCKAAEVEVE
jgi:hypothetical protein